MSDVTGEFADVPGGYLHYRSAGHGRDVVLLNPGSTDLRVWESTNNYLITLEDYLGRELDPPVKTRFSEITAPISVLVGGHDFEASRLWAQRIVNQAPDASLTLLAEADHFPMLSTPRLFERFLRETLA
jgi:pimeloyl-ACP methyl ester carboxylesterase